MPTLASEKPKASTSTEASKWTPKLYSSPSQCVAEGGARALVQPGGDVEVAAEAEAASADRDPAVQVDAEVAARVDPAERVQRREAEEVGLAAEAEEPLALVDRLVDVRVRARRPVRDLLVAADDHVDGRVQLDHVEQADRAVDVQLERVGIDRDPVRDVVLLRRVQPDLPVALDHDDVEDVEVDPDVELEHEADVVVRGVVVDAGEAARGEDERAELQGDVEVERERGLR